jgi:type I restriction enzyme R subunit
MDLLSVRLQRQYVEKFREEKAYQSISEEDKQELVMFIAPLVHLEDKDEAAKRFDNLMYGMMIASLEQLGSFNRAKQQLCDTAVLLEQKSSIPQVQAKMDVIKEVQTDAFWDANDLLLFEWARKELRDLIQFLMNGGKVPPTIITKLTDPILESQEGDALDAAYDFEDYRRKVNRYVEEHGDSLAIHKLTHNIPLSAGDYNELERILTSELGSREDYVREFGDTPFGLLVRKIAKLDHEAAMQAFSRFINDESLNDRQIAFVKKVIHHIEQNGYMESVGELLKPPFDKPMSFVKMFDKKTQAELTQAIKAVRENATNVMEA